MRTDPVTTAHAYLRHGTMRAAAEATGVTEWTVHSRLHKLARSPQHRQLWRQVRERIEVNLAARSSRGGKATAGRPKARRTKRR